MKTALCVLAGMGLLTTAPAISVPMENKIVKMACDRGLITAKERDYIIENGVVQECIDAVVKTGDVKAGSDVLIDHGVKAGSFKSREDAKAKLRNAAEKARKNDSLWEEAYRELGW